MRIGELAGLVGISTRAIRHYHRVGLLPEPARKANGYREYSLRDAVELARVRRLTELGLSLDEVGDVLAGDAGRDLVEISASSTPTWPARKPASASAGPGWRSCCGGMRRAVSPPSRRLSLPGWPSCSTAWPAPPRDGRSRRWRRRTAT
jgi:DNA-binding transcriptional MerR regulator